MAHLPRAPRRALALVLAGVLALPLAAVSITTASADVDGPPAFAPVATDAEQALALAQQVLAGEGTGHQPDATLALRELALALPALDRADRRTARALLARPNGGRQAADSGAIWQGPEAQTSRDDGGCSTTLPLCVHWTESGDDAPYPGDRDVDGVPNQVERTLAVMESVWTVEIDDMGFREPLTDERASIDDDDPRFDVYLSDIGDSGLYGYCAIDDSRALRTSNYRYYDFASYCVLDEDYARGEFGSRNTPLENLKVTAAHEFFHAIQFAYDATEDLWLAEGSAAWIEDEVYDKVNDNRQYLAVSQFARPWLSLDVSKGGSRYGSWGFWRYLTERFGPGLMWSVWQRADASPTGPDDYSLTALERVLRKRGADLTAVLGDFGLAIAEPDEFLEEGSAYPSASVGSYRLTRTGDSTGWRRFTLDHLSYAPVRILPGDRLRSDARLSITVDLPSRRTSPVARLLVVRDDGSTSGIRRIALNRKGDGSIRVGFSPGDVQRVVLTVGNASDVFSKCYSGLTQFSCYGGIPRDQNLRASIKAVVR